MQVTCESNSSSATEQIAGRIGAKCKGGEVIELISDLGGGKTTFVRGLARGLGSPDHVSSPTFMLSKVYTAGDIRLHHFDFYRLANAGVVGHELNEVLTDPRAVVVVEWADVVRRVLPQRRLRIHLSNTAETSRRLEFTYPKALSYLVEDLC